MKPFSNTVNVKIISAIVLVHFSGDFFGSFITPLFPVFIDKLGLSLAQVGIVSAVYRMFMFIVQPTIGYFADRYQTRFFVLGGLMLCVVFIPLSGIASSFWALLSVIALGSIGNSMFHPSTTGMVPLYAGRRLGFVMSIFNTSGTLAFGFGPIFITWYVVTWGIEAVPFTMVFGLAVVFYLYFTFPTPQSEGMKALGFIGTLKETLGPVWKPILLIWLVMVIRAIIGQSFLSFMPVLYVSRGFSLISTGAILSIFTVAGTISGLFCGYLYDKIGYKIIFYISYGLMTPMLILLLYLPGNWTYFGAALAGTFTLATLPLGVVMGQELAPRGRSLVASLMMGLAMGLGGLCAPVVGKLGDLYGILNVLLWGSFLPLTALVPIYFFPNLRPERKMI